MTKKKFKITTSQKWCCERCGGLIKGSCNNKNGHVTHIGQCSDQPSDKPDKKYCHLSKDEWNGLSAFQKKIMVELEKITSRSVYAGHIRRYVYANLDDLEDAVKEEEI